jgi:hypothetical protein
MKKKIIGIIVIILLFGISGGMLFWYFRGAQESEAALKQAAEKAKKIAPKEVTIKIYFGNKNIGSAGDCKVVFPVERVIPNDLIVRRRAVEELLRGPTPEEKSRGYFSNLPDKEEIVAYREKIKQETGVAPYEGDEITINSFKILASAAYIDFSGEMRAYGGGSCRVEAIKTQLNETVKQFPKVGGAMILIDGKENALQP